MNRSDGDEEESRLSREFFTKLMQRISPSVAPEQVRLCFEGVAGPDGKASFGEFVDYLCAGEATGELRQRAKAIFKTMVAAAPPLAKCATCEAAAASAVPCSAKEGAPAAWQMHGEAAPVFAEYLSLCHQENYGPLVDVSTKDFGKDDALIIVDMQNDFIPKDSVNPDGGRLPSTEGGDIAGLIVKMAELVADRGGIVVATRDYHPLGHCSFIEKGGSCPAHCVQGNVGSEFYRPIGDCLERLLQAGKRVDVVFKGFHEDVESFGSLTYSEVPPVDRGSEFTMTQDCPSDRCYGCHSLVDWTGSFLLKCSSFEFEKKFNVNAPPDVLAAFNRQTLADRLRERGVKRVFTCGLVFDLCVLDTSLNAVKAGFKDTFLVMDAARPIHAPGLGKIGSGFMNDIGKMRDRMERVGVRLVPAAALLPGFVPMNPRLGTRGSFPLTLGPFQHQPVNGLHLCLSADCSSYVASPEDASLKESLQRHQLTPAGMCCTRHRVTLDAQARQQFHIPPDAQFFAWCNPLKTLSSMREMAKSWFPTQSAEAAFLVHGGFVYLDAGSRLLAACTICAGVGLSFGAPARWRREYTAALQSRWSEVTIPYIVEKGALLFAWINPGEVLEVPGREPWAIPAPHGAFAYLFHENLEGDDERDIFFPVSG